MILHCIMIDSTWIKSKYPLQYDDDVDETPVVLVICKDHRKIRTYTRFGYCRLALDIMSSSLPSQFKHLSAHRNVDRSKTTTRSKKKKQKNVQFNYYLFFSLFFLFSFFFRQKEKRIERSVLREYIIITSVLNGNDSSSFEQWRSESHINSLLFLI